MSSKGYSAVPTDEPRDSADTESHIAPIDTQARDDAEDEPEGEPSANDRLLPFGPYRDRNGANRREPFQKRATRWIRSGSGRIIAHYRAFKKRCTARGLLLTAIIGFLLASTTGLAISTGILAKRPKYCSRWYTTSETRLPWNYGYGTMSRNYQLSLADIYPPLSNDAESSCKYAWSNMDYVYCHEKVLNRAWDNGKQQSVFEPRYDLYAQVMSDPQCLKDLEMTYQLLSSQCTSKDTFDMSEYIGPMTADPYLEEGPVAALQTLLDRVRHTSRQPPRHPKDRYLEALPCAAELYQDWFIIDGKNSGNLNSLDAFLTATNKPKAEDNPNLEYRSIADDRCDGAYAPYRPYWWNTAKMGPNDGDTQCSWCLINWFDRKLQSWEAGKVFDSKNGTAVSLPRYLRMIEFAGRRCQASDWERVFRKNVWMYQERGWLDDGWEGEGDAARHIDAGHYEQASRLDDWMKEYAEAMVEQTW